MISEQLPISSITVTEFIHAPALNYALQQAHVPIIRRLVLRNDTDAAVTSLRISVTMSPEFATPFERTIDLLPAGETIELEAAPMAVQSNLLAELTERLEAVLSLKIFADGQLQLEQKAEIAILPYDHWQGISVMPEGLAAFITPNHPQIPAIVRRAAEILSGWTNNPSFDEYQSRNPDRVRKQMAAIYQAMAELQVVYCSVPASFEETGQRVRLADAVLDQKLGNCLDLSLLYAACLEAVGIHPLIVIVHGHAFAGAWLIDESFADSVNDDPALLSKRMAAGINEIALVECTCMAAGKSTAFDDAVRAAEQRLGDTANFILFIDVKRARFSRIRPLPLRIATSGGFRISEDLSPEKYDVAAPVALSENIVVIDGKPVVVGKQQLWERKLLDLTLRNNLLNLRVTKGTIQFIHINPSKLEDALAKGSEFQILPKPGDWENPLRSAGLYQSLHDADPVLELASHELTQNRLRSYLTESELNNNLTTIYRASRTAMEENGASTLYIALGFLKWFETAASEVPRYAPILLLPVEIMRKSARQGFVIRSREEDPMMNITLLEKLRQDFGLSIGGLDVLPRDESGIDVSIVFNTLRKAVMAQPRWDVEEQVVLGTFSFSKFILWNDIHNNAEALLQNKTVASLVSGKLEWTVAPEAPRLLDDAFAPADIALPIPTDSSQLEAVVASGEGQSFVLHGPPGTGKSQTITNIIANALFAGKRVLFVAAKKAALDVVETRLENIGIGPFCLELHSNKARKTAVIEQLKRATGIARKQPPERFAKESERLAAVRSELNGHVRAMHKSWPFGLSLYDAFSRWSSEDEATPDSIPIPQSALASIDAERIHDWNDIVRELAIVAKIIGVPAMHALNGTAPQNYTQNLRTESSEALQNYINSLRNFRESSADATSLLQIGDALKTPSRTRVLASLVTAVLNLPQLPASLLLADSPEQTATALKGWSALGRARDAQRAAIPQDFNSSIFGIDAVHILNEWNAVSAKWFVPKWFGQNRILKTLTSYAANTTLDKAAIPQALEALVHYKELEQKVAFDTASLTLVSWLYRDEATNWDLIDAAADAVVQLNKTAVPLTGPAGLRKWRQAFAGAVGENTQTFVEAYRGQLERFIELNSEVQQQGTRVAALLHPTQSDQQVRGASWIDQEEQTATRWLSGIDGLKDWSAWIAASQKATAANLDAVNGAVGNIAAAGLEAAFRKSFYRVAAEYILTQSPNLAAFNSALFEEKIQRFRALSDSFEQLTRQELYARIAARIPDFSQEASQSSEVGILQKAIRSNGRAMSIRKLFDSIPALLPRIAPCALMSPISVAQYFEAGGPKFDLVIFDEASQLPTCEAIGAIARGSSVIVVGDPKQMPPTSFFATANVDEENLEKEDLESILDDCLALSMPSKYLLWHYRSKHESLIAFSNAKYYENSLLTFPSTDDLATKVTAVHVPGFYDKGKTRQNRAEAEAIVAEIIRRLSDPKLAKRSIGVVTFSVVQQNLIEDLLTEEFGRSPQLERIALDAEEPIFIKNLENVQGDERDVILFSVCYGPDEHGRVSLNFGPLNRDGGWRRLNVAVSRARYEMKVFATLKSEQIDLSRTGSEGVAGLRGFLAFAEKGRIALPSKPASGKDSGEGFEEHIADAIRSKGYDVHRSVGCSDYRIDMAVVHPDRPHEYLLGILCDGPAYGAAKTARDRELVQTGVLRTLGWNLHRIWAADWWEKPEMVLTGIVDAIEAAKNLKPDPEPESVPVEVPAEEEPAMETELNSTTPDPLSLPPGVAKPYQAAALKPVRNAGADLLVQPKSAGKISEQIAEVLELESPISKSLMFRRVLGAWGLSRGGARITAHLDGILEAMFIRQSGIGECIFLWKETQHPNTLDEYRVPENEAGKRDAEDISPDEIAVAIRDLLKRQLSMPRIELIRDCARLFGFARLGTKVEEAMQAGVEAALRRGLVKESKDRIMLGE